MINTEAILKLAHKIAQFGKVEFLVEHNVDVTNEKVQREFDEAFILALRDKNLEMIKFLASNGLALNEIRNETYLMEAVSYKNLDAVKIFIEHGANVNQRSRSGQSSALCQAVNRGDLEIVKYLVEHKANVNIVVDGDGFAQPNTTPLMMAVGFNRKLEIVQYLVEHGADVNFKNEKEQSVLSVATDPEIIKVLIEHGAKK